MGFADILRGGIATAYNLTGNLKVTVKHYAWTGVDAYNKPVYAAYVEREAIVDFKQRLRRTLNGQEVVQVATVLFLEPLPPNGASNRREPIDPRDKVVLPNGYSGPIVDIGGFMDSATDQPMYTEIALG